MVLRNCGQQPAGHEQGMAGGRLTAATLLTRLKLLGFDGRLVKAVPKGRRYRMLHNAARPSRGGRLLSTQVPGHLALRCRHRNRLRTDPPAVAPPDQRQAFAGIKEGPLGARRTFGHLPPARSLPFPQNPKTKLVSDMPSPEPISPA